MEQAMGAHIRDLVDRGALFVATAELFTPEPATQVNA
jgi:hypothetical protein